MAATNYTGNPTGVQAPDSAPQPGHYPVIAIPAGTDPPTIESISQQMKVSADNHAYNRSGRWTRKQELYELADVSIAATQNPVTNYPGLVASISGAGASIAIQGAGVGTPKYAGRSALITPGNAGGQSAWLASSSKIVPFAAQLNNQTVVIEFDVMFSAFNAAQTYSLGFSTALNGAQTDSITLSQVNQTWSIVQYVSGGSTLTALGAAVNPTAGVFQRMKLAWYGSATPQGVANGGPLVTASVNDVLTASFIIPTQPTANMYVLTGGAYGAASTMTVGTWTDEWNRY